MLNRYRDLLRHYFPILGLILVVIFFSLVTNGNLLSAVSLQSMLNATMTTALVSLGAVFVFGSGCFDMSLGGAVCLSAVLAGYAAVATGSLIVALLVCFIVSLFLGLLKGLFAAYVEVPLFIVTIVLGFIINAVVLVMMGNDVSIYLKDAIKPIPSFTFGEMTIINIVILGLFFILCLVLFNFTPLGREIKILGGNPMTARQSGMNCVRIKLVSFLVSAIGCALAAFIILARVRSVGTNTAGSMGTDVLVALVLGGMPLTGGPKSRISAGLIGAATISVLNTGLTMMGLSLATIQIVRAIIFLCVVYVASQSYRTELLPR
ncbi:MAG: ABC transporter permease [Clostridia bacterium]|nr:ABC transporter permease [Clostridia bacterium]